MAPVTLLKIAQHEGLTTVAAAYYKETTRCKVVDVCSRSELHTLADNQKSRGQGGNTSTVVVLALLAAHGLSVQRLLG